MFQFKYEGHQEETWEELKSQFKFEGHLLAKFTLT
jgi:hypothetical protein